MLGILIYAYFIILGYLYSSMIFEERDAGFKYYIGGIFGNLMLMAGIVPFALVLGFSKAAHIVLIIAAAIPYLYTRFVKRKTHIGNGWYLIDKKILLFTILPVSLIIWVLMTNHILAPYGDGVASGQCTYGDLQMHLGFITSIAQQGKFPPDYAFLSGHRLNYPFFADMLSSSLYLFGTPLRWAVLIPSYVISGLLVSGFYLLAYKITGKKSAAVLAAVFFFINGGFGFAYFIEGAKADPSQFTRIFTEYYHTPTNFNEMNIRWSNTICDMIIPQRTTMAGWCMIIPCIYLLIDALKSDSRRIFIILGIMAGCMPMIHTHSFLALGMISAVMFFAYLKNAQNKKDYIINWVIYGAIVFIMAFPQLIFWTFSQTSGNDSFLNFRFNWVNHSDPYLWFYIKNWGLPFILAFPAYFNCNSDNKKLFLSGLFIFVIAELIQFQPNEYDNNKLFYISYMIAIIITSDFLCNLYGKLSDIKARPYFAAVVIILCTLSGMLTIGREYVSGGQYQTFTKDDIEIAERIKQSLPEDAVVLTSTTHLNPVVTLAGRTVYVGSSLYVHFHGFVNEYKQRSEEVTEIYSADTDKLKAFCRQNGIGYVYVGNDEKNNMNINEETFSQLDVVCHVGNNTLYKIN